MHNDSQRVYPNFIDTLSDFGGLIDCILLFIYCVYWPYAKRRMHNNMIHKSLMITGKFNLDDEEAEYLSSIYSPAHYIKPSIKGLNLKSFCCKKSARVNPTGQGDLDDKLLEQVFDNMMRRQLDIRYIVSKLQEFEIIKKVMFHERHLVLAPLVC